MIKMYVVKVQDWRGKYIDYSYHLTEEGSEKGRAKANKEYNTETAYLSVQKLEA